MSTHRKQVDVGIATWISEFLLRQPGANSVASKFLNHREIPISSDNPRLTRTKNLKSIEDDVDEASVSERILDCLEIIAELDRRDGFKALNSIKAAYCSVAVECTAKYLAVGNKISRERYFEAVARVWRERIGKLEENGSELITTELMENRYEIETAIRDENVQKRFAEKNTRNEALRCVRIYVDEAKRVLGPPVLQSFAKILLQEQEGKQSNEGGKSDTRNMDVGVVDVDNDVYEDARDVDISEAASKSGNEEEMLENIEGVTTSEVGGGHEGRTEDNHLADNEVRTTSTVPNPGVTHGAMEGQTKGKEIRKRNTNKRAHTYRRHGGPVRIVDSDEPCLDTGNHNIIEHDPKTSKEGLLAERHDKSVNTEDMHMDVSSNKRTKISTPEVDKVLESLKRSCMELREVIRDPLPSALLQSENLVSEMLMRDSNKSGIENKRDGVDPCNTSVNPSTEPLQNESDVGTSFGQRNTVPKRSLMDRNGTAHAIEWEDSIEQTPETSPIRPRLASVKRKAVSPIKRYEQNMPVRRRRNNRWTQEEEDALRDGVQKFGRGNWKAILNFRRDVFKNRNEVDLKDKWRNLTRLG